MGSLEKIEEIFYSNSTNKQTRNYEKEGDIVGGYFAYIALIFYMILANVLLVNLLIAMFRYSKNE